ncbi:hypothetical protein F5X97DRAFT_320044 [Nemania serpens]|nr:hypothetical protein F5X97DRAFT_320044 [Nemania serpens]
MPHYREGSILGARSSTPDCGSHMHSVGFSHEPRRARSGSRPTEELVRSAPRKDAAVAEVRTWVLEVFHRRCHPDPERALEEFYWKGRDLHSQRRYLALRLRFRGEPYGYLIAHDIHDAVKESRKQSRRGKKEATKQAKKAKGGQDTHAITPSEGETTAHAAKKYEGDTKAIKPKAKRKLAKIFHIRLREPPPPSSSSRTPTVTITAASPPAGEDPFQDPAPAPKKAKPKTEKARKKEKMKEKWRKKTTRSLEAHDNAQDPFRDPEPMSLIDADDFRLESSEDTG